MKTKQLLLTLLAVLLPLTSWADVWQDPETKVNYEYTVGKSEASVKAGSYKTWGSPNAKGDITILSKFIVGGNEYFVTSIGGYAFQSLDITNVIIQEGVKSIGGKAFYNCTSLLNVTIPEGMTAIGEEAFYNCTSLVNVTIPETVTNIESQAFARCSSLTSINIPKNATVANFNFNPFYGCSSLTNVTINCATVDRWFSGLTSLQNVVLGDSVINIVFNAFAGCTGINSLTIPESVTSIERNAFQECTSLTKINIPKRLKTINRNTFEGCTGLHDIIFSDSLTTIAEQAFKGCVGLTNIIFPESVTSIGGEAFADCIGLYSVTINGSSINIGSGAFLDCTNLTDVAIMSSSVKNASNAFQGCTNLAFLTLNSTNIDNWFKGFTSLKNVTLTDNVTTIGKEAFLGCTGLVGINIPKNVNSIGMNAFRNCSSLNSIKLNSSVTSIDRATFYGCSSMTSLSIPSNITSIAGDAFSGCSSLAKISVDNNNPVYDSRDNCNAIIKTENNSLFLGCKNTVIPSSVTSIGDNAFYGSGLTSVYIPASIKRIGGKIFGECANLTKIVVDSNNPVFDSRDNCNAILQGNGTQFVAGCKNSTIPSTVIEFGGLANCSGLTSLVIPSNVLYIAPRAFADCKDLISITIPSSVVDILEGAFSGCKSLRSVNIPSSIPCIWNSTFSLCSNLTSITIPNSVTKICDDAFLECRSLSSITIPNSVTFIGESAFRRCSSLKSITIPSDVTAIYPSAFYECNLNSVTSMITEPFAIYYSVFSNETYNNATLYVPIGTIEAYRSTEGWKNFTNITEVDLGSLLTLDVKDENDSEITSGLDVLWYDSNGKQIGTGMSMYGIESGTELYYSVLLGEELGRVYREVKMQKVIASNEALTCKLERIEGTNFHGRVTTYGTAIQKADVSMTQWLNGKYEHTVNTKTDDSGYFTLAGYNDSTEITVSYQGFIDTKITLRTMDDDVGLGTIELQPITGKVIALSLSYQEASREEEEPTVQNWYNDIRNIEYSVTNVTRIKEITDFTVQQGNIILPDGTDVGDRLRVTLRSLNGKFAEASGEGIVSANDTASVAVLLVGLGGIDVIYNEKSDDQLLAMVFNADGVLVASDVISSLKTTFRKLSSGDYSLVTMGYSSAVGTVGSIDELGMAGMAAGDDYVLNDFTVQDGIIRTLVVESVPELDASKFDITSDSKSYLPNKTEMVVGNYVTMTARVDFKAQYADEVTDVRLVVDIPEGCEFIPNSVISGTELLPHSLDGNKLTISLQREYFDCRIRFCITPMKSGSFMSTARTVFNYYGEKSLPIGTAGFEATSGSISVPDMSASPFISVNGIVAPHVEVNIYDNDHLVGTALSQGDGKWNAKVELYQPSNLSIHRINATFTNIYGNTESTGAQDCIYDKSGVEVKTVTMVNTAHLTTGRPTEIVTTFNFGDLTTSDNSYRYWPNYPDFTFIADLTANDTIMVKGVTFYIHTTSRQVRVLKGFFDEKLSRWVATDKFESNSLPVNVSVDIDAETNVAVDDRQMAETVNALGTMQAELKDAEEQVGLILSQMETAEAATISKLTVQLSALLNIGYYNNDTQGLPSTEEWQQLRNETDAYIEEHSDIMKGFEDTELKKIDSDIAAMMEDICVKSAEGMDAATLISEGYDEISKTDGSKLYVKYDKNFLIMVDFTIDICITFTLSNMQWLPSQENLQKNIEYIKNRLDELVSTVTRMLAEMDSLSTGNGQRISLLSNYYIASFSGQSDAQFRLDCIGRLKSLVQIQVRLVILHRWLSQIRGGFFVKASWTLYGLLTSLNSGLQNMQTLDKLYKAVPECEASAEEAAKLKQQIESFKNETLAYYYSGTSAYMISLVATAKGLQRTLDTKGSSFSVTGISLSLVFTKSAMDVAYSAKCNNFIRYVNNQIARLNKMCGFDEDNDGVIPQPVTPNVTPIHDPSGFVYEAVPTNRVQGVTATIYYNENGPQLWDAADFSQVNPQITDETGLYQWDVPQGMWQVRFEKSGYETAQTEWLPVPPPQLEINIPMSQAVAPTVVKASGMESGITLDFSKYMKPATLEISGRVSATVNGKEADGDVEMLNLEEDPYNQKEFASKVKFVPSTAFKTSDEVVITVKKEVESYADKQMEADFVATVKIEPEINGFDCDSLIAVDYQGEGVLEIAVLPAAAAKGRAVSITSSSTMIATTGEQSVTLNDEGKATVTVSGNLPGSSSLHLQLDGMDIEKYVEVNVTLHETAVKKPKASKRSGSTIAPSYLLSLTCNTPGATIYYTLDGSCPCDEATRIKYTEPFRLSVGQVTLKAVAVRQGMEDSDMVTFTYSVKPDGDVNHDYTIDVADIAQIIDLMAGCECIPSDEADVNSDGVVDVADIATIISIMAGMR